VNLATAAALLNIAAWIFAVGYVYGWSHRPRVAGK